MLRGEHGRQVKELDRLVDWLAANGAPDVVCLSNALLLGLARRIAQRLGSKVVCMLQDEDEYLDALPPEHRREAWEVLRRRAAEVGAFVAPSRFYAGVMGPRLGLAADRIHVVHFGVRTDDCGPADSAPQTPVVGFLQRICHAKGADILAEAFAILKSDGRLPGARLRLAGGMIGADIEYVEGIRALLAGRGLADDVEFLPNLRRPERVEFLRSLSVLSVPERRGEAAGRYVLEAMACGVPVVAPRNGASPELLEATGGGLLCEPEDPRSLADSLAEVLLDSPRAQALGAAGRAAVCEKFDIRHSARRFAEVCELTQPSSRKSEE